MTESDHPYDEWYYRTGCGPVEYARAEPWLSFFARVADRIVSDIGPRTVLDVGCAMGMLVEALRDRGVDAFGIDVSEHAHAQIRDDVKEFCRVGSITDGLDRRYDLIVCIETLEHLTSPEAARAVEVIASSTDDLLFSSTSDDFREPTHVNVRTSGHWAEQLGRHGMFRDVRFDASFVAPHAVRFRRTADPIHRIVAEYEDALARLTSEANSLRTALVETRREVEGAAVHNEELRARLEERFVWTLVRRIRSLRRR
ncbi:MAG TPA: methyltransferase domain-containing protein [Actinomycetota bacterium]|nr:methyltransferase domain-containing protein [Actinomycetota bacterium]